MLKGPPKHYFEDNEYFQQKEDILQRQEDAMAEGLRVAAAAAASTDGAGASEGASEGSSGGATGGRKRKAPASKGDTKAKFWLAIHSFFIQL